MTSRPHRLPQLLAALALTVALPHQIGAQGLSLALEPVASGLFRPLGAVQAGDGSGRLFIVEQGGVIHVRVGGELLPTPFLDLTTLALCCGERGLLGLAFHPNYRTNGYFFVGYTDNSGDTVIARYSVSAGNANIADAGSALILLEESQPASNHNNGHMAFGPDGYLYIGMGDGGSGSSARGQDLTSLLGKILRIDPDGDDFPAEPNRNYSIPSDNPFVGIPNARDEIWAYGFRNPWRFSFDRTEGDLWIGDVGAGSLEEVDFQPASSDGGENYGWAIMEGTNCLTMPNCNDGSLTLPVLEYGHDPECAVTGGYRYRGALQPGLRGVYMYGDFCSGTVWGTVPRCDGVWESQELLASGLSISSFGEGEDGEIYVAGMDDSNGTIHRLTRSGAGGPVLASSTAALDFGLQTSGVVASLPFTLTNTNSGPEVVTIDMLALSDSIRFSLDLGAGATPCGAPPICLPPGAECTGEVDFSSLGGSFDESLHAAGNFDPLEIGLLAQVPCDGPENLLVADATLTSTAEWVGCQTVTIGPNVLITGAANAAIRAGIRAVLGDGVVVDASASVRIEIDPSLD